MLVVGALLVNNAPIWAMISLACISLLMIWYVWFRVIRARHLAVDYHKYIHQYIQTTGGVPEDICSEPEYIKPFSACREKTSRQLGIDKNIRLTRFKIDVVLPVAYSAVWLILVCYKLTH